MTRKIAIITGTRAEWGLLSPIARNLSLRPGVQVHIVATNMHLLPQYGHTVDEITADGFDVAARVPMDAPDDTPRGKVKAMAQCIDGMADALAKITPDIAVILGDRYEMLAAASAALMMRIPIAHIAGGEISEGAVDDSIRHAITKMASLHLTATEPYRRRVIQMGEDPRHVINTGAIGVYNILNEQLMPRRELEQSIDFTLDDHTVLLTYHPATADDVDASQRFAQVLAALDALPQVRVLFTYPNNDALGRSIIAMIEDYAASHPYRAKAVPSLGRRRYLSALQFVGAVVGNSSSGIVEVPSMCIPTVDIGIRQRGRIAAPSVIHCGDTAAEIEAAISSALSPQVRARAREVQNPYFRPDTLRLITDAIALTPLAELKTKHFNDLP